MTECATCQTPTANSPAVCDRCTLERRRHSHAKARARWSALSRRMRGAA